MSALETLRKDSHPVAGLRAAAAPQTQSETPTTKSLAKDQHISGLLMAMGNDLQPGVLSMNKGGPLKQYYSALGIEYGSNKKVLKIPDFVTATLEVYEEDEADTLIKGERLLICKDAKPKVTEGTLPEWISANARIPNKLINQYEIVSLDDVKWYMEYTAQIGDHAWENTIPSVMDFNDK